VRIPKRKALAASLGAIATALAACQVLVGVTDDEGTPRPAGGAAAGDLCPHAQPPVVPADASDGPDLPPAWFAMTTLEGLPRADGRPVGFDLDGRCTGFPLATAFDASAPCGKAVIDDLGGVDNAAARMFGALPVGYGKTVFDGFQSNAKSGGRTLLIYLAKYDGQPNDPLVEARIVPSEALQSTSCDGGPLVEAGTRAEGCDTWSYAQGALTPFDGGATPPVVHQGFVVDGRLVLGTRSSIDLDLVIGQGLFPLPLSGAILVARLGEKAGPNGAALRTLSGTIAGRVSSASLLSAVSRNPSLCNPAQLEAFKDVVCEHRDMPSSLGDDPSRICTHVSVGLSFQSIQAKIGGAVPPAAPLPLCDASIPSCE